MCQELATGVFGEKGSSGRKSGEYMQRKAKSRVLQFCDNLCPHLCTRASRKARRPHYPLFGRPSNHMRRFVDHLDSHPRPSTHLIIHLDSYLVFLITIGCLMRTCIYTSSYSFKSCVTITTASCRPIRSHDHACSSELWHSKKQKNYAAFLACSQDHYLHTKPSDRPINHHSFPLIIVAHDNAGTLGAQDSDSAFSFHRVVDIVQTPVPHCSILPARSVRIGGRGWLEG
jgi:hypothetical protein